MLPLLLGHTRMELVPGELFPAWVFYPGCGAELSDIPCWTGGGSGAGGCGAEPRPGGSPRPGRFRALRGAAAPSCGCGTCGGTRGPCRGPHPRFSAPICWPESWGCAWSCLGWREGGRSSAEGRRLISAPVPVSLSKAGRCDAGSREFFPSPQTCPFRVTWLRTGWFEEGHNLQMSLQTSPDSAVVYGCSAVHLHAIVPPHR